MQVSYAFGLTIEFHLIPQGADQMHDVFGLFGRSLCWSVARQDLDLPKAGKQRGWNDLHMGLVRIDSLIVSAGEAE